MLTAIKWKLELLYQSTLTEFHKTPVQAFAAAIVICGVLFSILVSLWPKDFFSNPIVKYLQNNTETNLSLLILSLGLLVWSYVSLQKKTEQINTNHPVSSHSDAKIKFIPVDDLIWKTEIYGNDSFNVDGIPYCKKHELSFVIESHYWVCPEYIKHNCDNRIYQYDLSSVFVNAKSYIEKEIRNNTSYSTSNSVLALDDTKTNILKLLHSQNMTSEQIANSLKLKLQTAVFHLEELATLNMIIMQRHRGPRGFYSFSDWTLKQPGRKYIIENKIVS